MKIKSGKHKQLIILKEQKGVNMRDKIKKLEEMQEDIEKLISDNEEASQVWKMFDNLVDKLEDIHEEQEKTEERTYNGK